MNKFQDKNVFCIPGDRLCGTLDAVAGEGTYIRDGTIFASVLGKLKVTPGATDAELPSISVSSATTRPRHLQLGSIVVCKVTSVQCFHAKCEIIAADNVVLEEPFRGIIKKEDIRSFDKDKVKFFATKSSLLDNLEQRDFAVMAPWYLCSVHLCGQTDVYNSFRPGDIVLAKVISVGDSEFYFLTTMEDELGVVTATSEMGAQMIPISWNQVQCPKSAVKENRKVAKIRPEFIFIP